MSVGRVTGVYRNRLGCTVSATVVGDNTVKLIPVDSFAVDFAEEGGQFQHQPTGDLYTYASADIDAETITLAAGLPSGKTLTADDALFVYPRAVDYFADVMVDDVDTDVVSARVPQHLRSILAEGTRTGRTGELVKLEAAGEEWQITELTGTEPVVEAGAWVPGDVKIVGRAVTGGGVLVEGAWLKCDGTAVSRATYAALWNAIGVTFGAGNGSTTFNVPDARGRAVFGTGTIVALAANEGKTEANRGPSHVHSISAGGGHNHNIPSVSHSGASNAPGTGALDKVALLGGTTGGSHDHTGSTGTVGDHSHTGETGGAMTSSDPMSYLGLHLLIKT